MSTAEYLNTLTIDQLRYARDYADEKIKQAEDGLKRVVWQVCRDGIQVDSSYREEEYEKAADRLIAIFKEHFVYEAQNLLEFRGSTYQFSKEIPSIEAMYVTQTEYDAEWFPAEV